MYLLPAAKAFSLDEKATSPSVTRTANLFIQRFIDRGNRLGARRHESKNMINGLRRASGDGSGDLATSGDDGDFDAFSGEGEIQCFLIVS